MKTKLTSMLYLGYTSMDRRFSNAMLPWLLREIKKTGTRDKLSVTIEEGQLKTFNENFEPVFVHRLVDIIRASQVPGVPEELFYICVNEKDGLLYCYLFRANTAQEVTELFGQMRESSPIQSGRSRASPGQTAVTKNIGFLSNSNDHVPWTTSSVSLPKNCHLNLSNDNSPFVRSNSGTSALSLCADLSPSDSHFFEVLYIGKVRISQRKVPDTLIDDALNKFAQHEAEKAKTNEIRRSGSISSQGNSLLSITSEENLSQDKLKTESNPLQDASNKRIIVSITPLEPDKGLAWKSAGDIHEEPKSISPEADLPVNQQVDNEFDQFTKDRLEKSTNVILKRPSQVPLEPNILVLNIPKNNLTTLTEDEEKQEDLHSMLTDTASSITQFCKENFLKDISSDHKEIKPNNPFLDDIFRDNAKDTNDNPKEIIRDPLFNIPVSEKKDYIHNKENIEKKVEIVDKKVLIERMLEKNRSIREDSPLPTLNFDEISRKPKMLSRSKSGLDPIEVKKSMMPENKPFLRDRSASIGTLNLKTPIAQVIGEQNRTMLFQVGRSELRLISPDRKQILLHRTFKDVASCVLGRHSKDHFGFVCRETTGSTDSYACYVFKCESDAVALEVINAIKQAFIAHAELLRKTREKSPNLTCEHCPMLWYHRLCHDIEGMNEKKTHAFILRRMEQLPEVEQDQIITKYQVGTNHLYEVSEHNAFLMILLRAHCEARQQRHVHDTAENRSEFLNQYLGGSTIFMKAKRSLSSGFDHLLKRRPSKDDMTTLLNVKKETSPNASQEVSSESTPSTAAATEQNRRKSMSPGNVTSESKDASPPPAPASVPETPTEEVEEVKQVPPSNTPMMDIFMKVNDTRSADDETNDLTWRQAIYRRHVELSDSEVEMSPKKLLGLQTETPKGKKTPDELRQLWKMAIEQTILLARMEKENARLKENEESSAVRRIKLEYNELGACDAGVTLMWDSLLTRDVSHHISKVDKHMLRQAVIQGVPRTSRGSVWYFLAEQASLRCPPPDVKRFPNYNTPYHTLLAGLTKHQHAILIDLGRTFPQHTYFASALGPGQLSLYNILKAYSMLDPDVGYCQGLSFVAGVLLLHMEEAEAFILLRHLMFRRGLRKQYLPDMRALQVQLYQLSRLIKDHEPELHAKLEALDVSPALYAAPWMLTLFTSQFPLGFVVRVFDLIFLDSLDVVFAVSLALLTAHKDGLMMCESCEEAAEYLKHKMPDIDSDRGIYEKVMKKVHTLDITRQLADYAVEYSVLSEEVPKMAALMETNAQLQADKRRMSVELDSAMGAITNYETTQVHMETQLRNMEQHLTVLSKYIAHQKEAPPDIKKIIQLYNKKQSFGAKMFSNKFANENDDSKRNVKTGMSTPNLFSKLTKEDIANVKNIIDTERKSHFVMKKSLSVHSGLIVNNAKQYPLKILEEKSEEERSRKNSNVELIEQERLFEQKLKQDFDENLKRLDEKLSHKLEDQFQNRRTMSLNIIRNDKTDSGFVTPISPDLMKDDNVSVTSHPLSDCDVEIKFDGQSTKLKQIRPVKQIEKTSSVDSGGA